MTLPDNYRKEMVYHDNDEASEQFALAGCRLRQIRQLRQSVSELSAHSVTVRRFSESTRGAVR